MKTYGIARRDNDTREIVKLLDDSGKEYALSYQDAIDLLADANSFMGRYTYKVYPQQKEQRI